MSQEPDSRRRCSIRLQDYDYAQAGAYFVTICTHNRVCMFGEIVSGEIQLNAFGEIVVEEWGRCAEIRAEIDLDEWVVMPNHLHGIVVIVADLVTPGDSPPVGAHGRAPLRRKPRSLGSCIAGFKSAVTARINTLRGTPGAPVWQRNYYEHVVRDEDDLARIREYVADNPVQWGIDRNNLHHLLSEKLRD